MLINGYPFEPIKTRNEDPTNGQNYFLNKAA